MDRRDFCQSTLGSLVTLSLLESLFACDALGQEIKPLARQWLAEINSMSNDLKGQKLKQLQWQAKVEQLFEHVDLPELLAFVDFDKLTQNLPFRDRGERAVRPKFPEVEGLPTNLVFGHQIFAMKKGQSVAPHGHNNMATAFLILKGEFQGRHYDRLEDEAEHLIIKPTINRSFKPGEYSTVSDFRDNIHWFQGASETAFLFNIHVLQVDAQGPLAGRVYVDPNGELVADGRIRARKISAKEAYELYG